MSLSVICRKIPTIEGTLGEFREPQTKGRYLYQLLDCGFETILSTSL
jgi:hypothetical protein